MSRIEEKSTEQRIKDLLHADPKDLREGVTTGTCAAAAAAASAAAFLKMTAGKDVLSGEPCMVSITTPGGKTVDLEIVRREFTETEGVRSTVIKDAGDDPDVTDGAEICAEISRIERSRLVTPDEMPSETVMKHAETAGCDEREMEGPIPVYMDPDYPGIALTGGEGVGICTKKGLPDPVGFPAINPVPRNMILREVHDVVRRYAGEHPCEAPSAVNHAFPRNSIYQAPGKEDREGGVEPGKPSGEPILLIRISIPKGRELAEKTFNPKLGIVGGLSVLGTTGIVHPMSEDALIRSVELEIRVRSAEGRTVLAIAPGNYGRQYLHDKTGLDMEHFVKCSNYVGEAFRMLDQVGVKKALFAGHPGKLIKVAGGILNTHSKYGDHRMEIMADCARAAGADEEMCRRILNFNTTNEASEYLDTAGLRGPVYAEAAARVKCELEAISHARVEVMFLDGERGLLAQTDGAEELVRILSEEEKTIYG